MHGKAEADSVLYKKTGSPKVGDLKPSCSIQTTLFFFSGPRFSHL